MRSLLLLLPLLLLFFHHQIYFFTSLPLLHAYHYRVPILFRHHANARLIPCVLFIFSRVYLFYSLAHTHSLSWSVSISIRRRQKAMNLTQRRISQKNAKNGLNTARFPFIWIKRHKSNTKYHFNIEKMRQWMCVCVCEALDFSFEERTNI